MIEYPPIGIAGRKRTGKNTFADLLTDAAASHGIPTVIRAFADPLREVLLATDPIIYPAGAFHPEGAWRLSELFADGDTWETIKDDEYMGPEVRRLLQNLGTEGIRAKDPEFWTIQARDYITTNSDSLVIFPDVRFPNEAEVITDLGGTLVYIDRPGLPDDGDTHSSESLEWLKGADYIVHNTGDVEDLVPIARSIIREYF